MCLNKIFHRFGNNNKHALLGVTHNSKLSLEIVEYLLKNYNFNNYYIELNNSNAYFILKNNFFHSEFFPILRKFYNKQSNHNKNLELIDISIESEVILFSKINRTYNNGRKDNFFNDFINYKLAKYAFYKLWGYGELKIQDYIFDFNEAVKELDFYQSHVLFREFIFLYKIRKGEVLEIDNSKDKKLKKYFGKNYDLFLREAEENFNEQTPLNFENNLALNNKNVGCNVVTDKKLLDKNEILVVLGLHHFENFVKNDLI